MNNANRIPNMPRPSGSPQLSSSTRSSAANMKTKSTSAKSISSSLPASTALFGAAIQQELMRSMNGSSAPRLHNRNHNPHTKRQRPERLEPKSKSSTTSSTSFQMHSSPQPGSFIQPPRLESTVSPVKLTLAQQLGIQSSPAARLTPDEWQKIEQLAIQRKTALQGCCICCDSFASHKRSTVITSCSHLFHHTCLASLERYSIQSAQSSSSQSSPSSAIHHYCPYCRSADYEKRTTSMPRAECRLATAITIQRIWRGVSVRMQPSLMGRKSTSVDDSTSSSRHRDAIARVLSRRHYKLEKLSEQRDSAIDALFAELDSSVAESRRTMSSAQVEINKLTFAQAESDAWTHARQTAIKRLSTDDDEECAICCVPMQLKQIIDLKQSDHQQSKMKPCVLLSCTHVLHADCLSAYEKYALNSSTNDQSQSKQQTSSPCPYCRQTYDKQTF